MGLDIERDRFEDADYDRFRARLADCVDALRTVVARPGFGAGPATIGVELEMDLVDGLGRPMAINREVIARSTAPLTIEIDRFNLELNTAPLPLAGRPFSALQAQLDDALREVRRAASTLGARVAIIGILPTLRERDLQSSALTDTHRFRALSAAVRRMRGEPLRVRIEGLDPEEAIDLVTDDVAFEGANTALQVHLKVPPERFAACFNAAQIVAAPALACSTNSPLFLGRRLWEETRIALFRQSVDERREARQPARVTFGHGWVRRGVVEIFEESVAMYDPLLPVVSGEDPRACVSEGKIPKLHELRLHNSTSWRWNRPVYDGEDGHLRIEMRAFPAGPTVIDMVATAAFAIGATLGLARRIDDLLAQMTFGHARENFYEAARVGLDALLFWPYGASPSPRPARASDVVRMLLPIAREALVASDVAPDEADAWLRVVEQRVSRGATGARWQRATYDALVRTHPPLVASARMLDRYMACSEEGTSVAGWPKVES